MKKSDCYARAEEVYRKKAAEFKAKEAERVSRLYEKLPDLQRLDDEIKRNMSEFAVFAFSGSRSDEKFYAFRDKSLTLQAERRELLSKNGYSEDASDIKYYCPICKDTTYTENGMCECFKRELAIQFMESSNLSAVYKEKTFDKFKLSYYSDKKEGGEMSDLEKMTLIVKYLKKYIKTFGVGSENLLFAGASGAGKTFLSCAVGTELIKKGVFVVYTPVQELISVFEADKFGKKDRDSDTSRFFDCDLLIIDDLGTEFQTPYSDTVLYEVINTRINTKKPMIISTNCFYDDLRGQYHDRLLSRLSGEFLEFVFANTDVRYIKKHEKLS